MEECKGTTDSQFEDRIFFGLAEIVSTWAGNQKDALDNVMGDTEVLKGESPFVKAATWLSMGAQGTFTFFPRSALVASLERIAIPIAIVCLAVEIFKADYENHVKKFNTMMLGSYTKLRDELKGKIDQVKISFLKTDFGSHVLDTLRDVLKKRQKYLNANEVYSHTMDVLIEQAFGIIESNPDTIQTRTSEGFVSLANKKATGSNLEL